jgi:hypothetical protein
VAVVSPQFGKDNLKEIFFLRKIALKVNSRIEPVPFSPTDITDRYSTLAQEIKKYGINIDVTYERKSQVTNSFPAVVFSY